VSGLTDNGLPVAGVGKIVYPSNNKYIVESKSFKLYFNSFNGTKLGEDPEEVREKIALKASKDLSDLLETDVKVHVFSNYEVLSDNTTANEEWQSIISKDKPYNEYITLEDVYPIEEVVFDTYKETPELLKVIEDAPTEWVHYHSALLKSNCRVTSQPDWGDVYIDIKCDNTIDPVSLVKYIVSFRDECHFHEEICETIYKRIWDTLKPEKLAVKCLYARRGGIDINPERVSDADLLHTTLSNPTVSHIKTPKQ